MEEKKQGKLRTVIIALAVLLALSLLVLAGTLIHNHNSASQPTSVVIPDNVITPTDDPADSSQTEDPSAEDPSGNSASQNGAGTLPAGNSAANNAAGSTVSIVRTATALYLDKSNPGINAPFQASNMFPGDNVIKNYRIRVYHRGNVVLRFHAAVRPGYEKLAAKVPLKEMSTYSTSLSSLTGGRASFIMKFASYELVPADVQDKLIKEFEAKQADE